MIPDEKALGSDWAGDVHAAFTDAKVSLVSYVPDAGLKRLIELCQADEDIRAVPLTTEEEGVGLAMGAWLGGKRSVLLLQSSGVGNLVNTLGAVIECRFPLLMIATMRGEEGEFNPWQVPMGQSAPGILERMGLQVRRIDRREDAGAVVGVALEEAFDGETAVGVLISQSLVGVKSFQEQVDR